MKRAVILILSLILLTVLVTAANETSTTDEQAYSCMENLVEDNCDSLNFEEIIFSILSLSYDSGIKSECTSALNNLKDDSEACFPDNDCEIKDTALSIIALKKSNQNSDDEEKWLLKQNITIPDLEWYLQIGTNDEEATECEISYGSSDTTINIDKNQKISGSTGSCLSLAYNDYWLKIDENCLDETFTVSCDKDFYSSLIFKKPNSDVWYISDTTQSSTAKGNTEHKISSICLSTSSSCDYESNLWAALALKLSGKKIDNYIPYLTLYNEDNEDYFPQTFLYLLTNKQDYLTDILDLQESQGYWDLDKKGKYYDTALALLSLTDSTAETDAKEWLTENQDTDGCWNNNNIRDTGFILWAAYTKAPSSSGNGTNNGGLNYCEDNGYYCISSGECAMASGSEVSSNYCYGADVCCTVPAQEQTCSEKQGAVCSSDKQCSISEISTSDTTKCCLGTCETPSTQTECESLNYRCRTSCFDYEESAAYDCNNNQVCCKETTTSGGSYWWLWVLIILIVLVILGIIFRDKLRLLMFKIRGGSESAVPKTRPSFPPSPGPLRRMTPGFQQPRPQPRTKSSDELEDTLKKLREMSK